MKPLRIDEEHGTSYINPAIVCKAVVYRRADDDLLNISLVTTEPNRRFAYV